MVQRSEEKTEAMPFLEHLVELRKRIIWVLLVLVASLIGGLVAAEPLVRYFKNTEPALGITWNVFSPWDSIVIYMKVAFIIALALTLPVIVYHLWAFVKPGLKKHEQQATVKYIPLALLFFCAGLSFAYFVIFPLAFHFTESVTIHLELTQTYGIAQYFSFMFNILLPVSLLFELPVLVMFLTRIRILNPGRLRKARKIAYLALVIIATTITPPDLISDLLVAAPLILLYEISVWLSALIYRRQLLEDARAEALLQNP
jgi:sec-independent protein translocase protein TatC